MKKRLFTIIFIIGLLLSCFCNVNAESTYMSAKDAKYFLCFVYNVDTDHVTEDALSDDIFYKMLTGAYSNDKTYELAAKAAFLSHMDARIIDTLEKANVAVNTSRDYLIEYLSKNLGDDSTGLVTDIYKENVAKSILNMCGGEEVFELCQAITNASEAPEKYLDDVKGLMSAFAYTYGQNVTSLYTYFDAAMSSIYLKSTEGAYETAMAYNIMALKDSIFMSFAAKLIPGITSWEEWIDKMDYWAEYAYNMKGSVSAGNSSDFKVVVFHPNCDELNVKILWYTEGQLYAPVTERDRYVLQGWYLDEDCTVGPIKNDYVPTEKVVYLYAKWERRYFTISFKSNCEDVEDYIYELDRLNVNWYEPVMQRTGYIFNGWYWDAECKNPVEGEFTVDGDMTFYAGWVSRFGYTVSDNKATISYIKQWETDENGNKIWDFVIPEKIGGYSVADVDFSMYSKAVTGITFPDSMTNIKKWSFSWFSSLKNVVLNDGILVIEDGAFARDYALESVAFGNSLKTIGSEAFISCSKITEINLPESLITIGNYAFSGCGISELKIPNSVTEIGNNAFSYCESLTTVEIGKSVTTLSGNAFEGCTNLESISVAEDNQYFSSMDGVLYNKDKTVLYKYPASKNSTTFKVPETVNAIAESAFYGAKYLESIDISNVRIIGDGAFKYCEKLTGMDLSSVSEIGTSAFYSCKSLNAVQMPPFIKELKNSTFYGCTSLEKIVIPANVETIGWDCFSECESIKEISIPDSVTYMDTGIFYGCKNLSLVKLPQNMTEIPASTFGMCESLESIDIPQSVTNIGYGAFYGCAKLNNITLPSSVTFISSEAFCNCTSLEKLIIPDGVTGISYMTFYGCTALKKLIIPQSVTFVDFDNFSNTTALKEVYFMGTAEEWSAVSISEYGNDYLSIAGVMCESKVIADICNIERTESSISGKVEYYSITESTDVVVALYDDGVFVGLDILKADSSSTSTEFEIECEKDKTYEIRVFFWSFTDMLPNGINQSMTVQ